MVHDLLYAMSMMTSRLMTKEQRKEAKDMMLSAMADFELNFPAYAQVPGGQQKHLAETCPFWFASMWSF